MKIFYTQQQAIDYARIEKAIVYLNQHYTQQPDLNDLAKHLKLSPHHLQKLFHRWAGLSPKQFVGYLTLQRAKNILNQSKNVLDTSLDSGLSGPGRLHDLFVTIDAVSPGEFKKKGEGLTITYGIHPTIFGSCLIASTPRGICHLSFFSTEQPEQAHRELSSQWKNAKLVRDEKATRPLIDQIFKENSKKPIQLFLRGTNFQLKVWEALIKIRGGSVISYEGLAKKIKKASAARAVSRAVATNPISYLIPCHRVIHKNGIVEGYRWGSNRKKAMLLWESRRKKSPL